MIDQRQIHAVQHVLEPTILRRARFPVLAGELAAIGAIERLDLLECWDAVDVVRDDQVEVVDDHATIGREFFLDA